MSNSGFNSEPDVPPPGYQGAVWPPPPVGQEQGPWYPFKTLLYRVEGSVPDFRLGSINLSPEGVLIQGKAVTRAEIQVPILIVSALLIRLAFFIAYFIMEYGVRRDDFLSVPWNSIRQVVLVPKKRRVCLVYDAPNYKGIIKTFSLAFALEPSLYQSFTEAAVQHLSGRVSEGKLRVWRSQALLVFLAALIINLGFLLIAGALGGFDSGR